MQQQLDSAQKEGGVLDSRNSLERKEFREQIKAM